MSGPKLSGPGPAPSGTAGATTVVASGSLTANALVTGGGTTTLQTPSATSTLDSSGNLSIPGRYIGSVNGASLAPPFSLTGTIFTGGGTTNTKPALLVEPTGASSVGWSNNGTIIGANAPTGFAGDLLHLKLDGANRLTVSNAGSLSAASSILAGAALFLGWTGRALIGSPADSRITLFNSGAADFDRLQFGGTTTSFPALSRSTTKLSLVLADGTSGGSFDATGSLINTGITTDATHTDTTVCQDTTSHIFYAGSGAVGICLGTSSRRYKSGIREETDGLSEVMELQPVRFRFDANHGDGGAKEHSGFTAEDIAETKLARLVDHDKDGRPNSYDWSELFPVLVNAIKDLHAQNQLLNTRLNTFLNAR